MRTFTYLRSSTPHSLVGGAYVQFLLLLLLVVGGGAISGVSGLSLERVRLMDYNNQVRRMGDDHPGPSQAHGHPVYLFRGDVPTWGSDNTHFTPHNRSIKFQNDTLIDYFNIRLKEANLSAIGGDQPANTTTGVYIIDVNLLSDQPGQQMNAIDAEEEFFSRNPSLGQYVHWRTVGSTVDAMELTPQERDVILKNQSKFESEIDEDDLGHRIPQIHRWIHSEVLFNTSLYPNIPAGVAVVVYFHCIGGQDRTSEISGSYTMQYLNWTAQQSFTFNHMVAERWQALQSRQMMQWWCLHLQQQNPIQYHGLGCGAIPVGPRAPSPPAGPHRMPCLNISTFHECGECEWCLWNTPHSHCESNCAQWTSLRGCALESGCEWVNDRECLVRK